MSQNKMSNRKRRRAYFNILRSGFLTRIFPSLTGVWSDDKDKWQDIHEEIYEEEDSSTKDKKKK